MAIPSRFGRLSLAAIFLFFLSLLNIVNAAPPPFPDDSKKPRITEQQYMDYLKAEFPKTDHYIFYSGDSMSQVKKFQAKNSGYFFYNDLFTAEKLDHPWYKHFDADKVQDDGEASSRAMAKMASGEVLVFGAIEYKDAGKDSYFTRQEAPSLADGIKAKRIKSVNHMIKDTESATGFMAKETGGDIVFEKGYKKGDKNASGNYDICKRGLGGCGAPVLPPKKSKTGPKF